MQNHLQSMKQSIAGLKGKGSCNYNLGDFRHYKIDVDKGDTV